MLKLPLDRKARSFALAALALISTTSAFAFMASPQFLIANYVNDHYGVEISASQVNRPEGGGSQDLWVAKVNAHCALWIKVDPIPGALGGQEQSVNVVNEQGNGCPESDL